ncbi:MAG: UPF0104 family protein [Candidatus Electrothrix sp. AR3]|nr:UPF0104 family protein [Candidatus Electrothrix sp. AR3]
MPRKRRHTVCNRGGERYGLWGQHARGALLLQTVCNSVASFRWSLIMAQIKVKLPALFYLKSYFKGIFFNQGLPTSIGGDGIRILDCARSGGSTEQAFFGVFIDRIIGLTGLLLLNITALTLNHSLLPAQVHWPLLLILIVLALGLLLLFFLRQFSFFAAGKYLGFLGRLSEHYFQVYSSPASICTQLCLSMLVHLLSMGVFFLLGQAVGLGFSLQVYLVLVPPVILLTILPLSLAGWGIREGAMVGFFLLIGADKSLVLTLSVLYGLNMLVASLPGLFIYLTQKNKL